MVFSPVIAVYDACILYPFHLRNIIVQIAVDRLVEARWSDEIHDEWMRNLTANAPSLTFQRLQVTRQMMETALPSANVSNYEMFKEAVTLPDTDDRHVVAVAIAAKASTIITWNLRDFPDAELEKQGMISRSPDSYLTALYDSTPELVVASLSRARGNLRRSGISAKDFVDVIALQNLRQLACKLEKHIRDL